MPKRRLEEAHSSADGLDGEWVGRWVMLRPAVSQRKRLPENLVAKISHVYRSGMTASVLLEYSADGIPRTSTISTAGRHSRRGTRKCRRRPRHSTKHSLCASGASKAP